MMRMRRFGFGKRYLKMSKAYHHDDASRFVLGFANRLWQACRPKPFVLVIEGELVNGIPAAPSDYLHDHLLQPEWREAFYQLVDTTGLVVCLNLHTAHPTYRDVRGRSSRVDRSRKIH